MYAITGATGNTGSVVARNLLAKGEKVRVIGRSAERLESLTRLGAEAFVCDLADSATLTKALTGARAVYAMIPPNLTSPGYRAYQDGISDALARALQGAGVKHAVSLSSFGTDKTDGTGPVVGLRRLEEKLNAIPGLNVLHLRAGYFMENTLPQISIIKMMGITAGPVRPDLPLPMIATCDIGVAAAEALLKLNFGAHETQELLGQRDLNMTQATAIIGKAIANPGLRYMQAPSEQFRAGMTQLGVSVDFANLILEMAAALNSGHMGALETRSARNTTPTSYETFVNEEFVPRYHGKEAHA